MDIGTAILVVALGTIVILFGIGMFGISFGEERQTASVDMQEATRIVLTEFPNTGIVEMERDREHGHLMYEVELVTAEEQKKHVHVNNPSGPERIIVCSACRLVRHDDHDPCPAGLFIGRHRRLFQSLVAHDGRQTPWSFCNH